MSRHVPPGLVCPCRVQGCVYSNCTVQVTPLRIQGEHPSISSRPLYVWRDDRCVCLLCASVLFVALCATIVLAVFCVCISRNGLVTPRTFFSIYVLEAYASQKHPLWYRFTPCEVMPRECVVGVACCTFTAYGLLSVLALSMGLSLP